MGRLSPSRLILMCVGALPALATFGLTDADAQDRTVSPDRWVREICSGWSEYADKDVGYGADVDEVLTNLEGGEIKPKAARERLLRAQRGRVKAIDRVVRVVQKSDVPDVENGATIRLNYLDTVKDYQGIDTRQLDEYRRRLAATSGADLHAAIQEAETRRYDEINNVAYDPLEELRQTPVLATAIENATRCGDVAEWLDQSGLSAEFGVGQCLDITGNATPENFELVDTEEVDCAAPHLLEVFVQTEHDAPVGAPYPGDKALAALAEQHCIDAFPGYVGRDLESSSFAYWVFYPDADGWRANNREVLCFLAPSDNAPITGPAQGSGR